MNIKYDYSEQYEKLLELLTVSPQNEVSEREKREAELVGELTEVILSQYREYPNEELSRKIEKTYFPFLDELARLIGGCAEQEINKKTGICNLSLLGKEVIFTDNKIGYSDFYRLSMLVHDSESFTISAREDQFVLRFTFNLKCREKIVDRTTEIEQIKRELRESLRNNRKEELLL